MHSSLKRNAVYTFMQLYEQSYYKVYYTIRKEEGKKEERNEQTPTIYNSLKGLEKYTCMCTHSQLQQLMYMYTYTYM